MKLIKYVRTKENKIIVFSASMNHSDFSRFNPISAGFISFGTNKEGNPTCSCSGYSFSLGLDSKPEEDTLLAKQHFGMFD